MQHRTCELCEAPLAGRQRRFCCKQHARRVHKAEARIRGVAWAQNAPVETRKEDMVCSHCDTPYRGYRSTGPEHRFAYCSQKCQAESKAQRYTGCTHGTTGQNSCPACTFIDRSLRSGSVAYRKVLRADPCSYCGGEAQALDHIDPAHHGGADDWENRTSACRRCNSYKGTLSLLQALPWIPAASAYHEMRRQLFAA
jgi:hypothetical protein